MVSLSKLKPRKLRYFIPLLTRSNVSSMQLTRSTRAVAEAQQGTQRPQPLNTGAGSERKLAVLIVTAMYPHSGHQSSGAFVKHQVERLQAMGHRVETVDFPGYRSKLEYAKAALAVRRRTREKHFDVVHAHYGVTGLCALVRNGTPLVVSLHGSDALVGWIEPLISRLVCSLADGTIVVSRKIAERIPGTLIPCGVDLGLFQPRPKDEARRRLGLTPSRKYVLFPFDRSRSVKRFDLATAAVRELADSNAELLTVSQVHYTEMPWFYSAADVMILCSDSEGSPTSVKEALACNLPVVSVDIGDVREMMDGIEGAEIVERTPASLAAGVRRVLERGGNVAFNGRAAMERYSQQKAVEAIVAVYRRVIEQRLLKHPSRRDAERTRTKPATDSKLP
jgi:glycosyltransferase involved in cell wall biosynthesis